jgi:predicted DNA-binding transcriptional regulator AlpA
MTTDEAIEVLVRAVHTHYDPGDVSEAEWALTVIRDNIGIPPDDIISAAEVRQLAGIKQRSTLLAWVRDRGFPEPFKVIEPNIMLYDRRDVDAWLSRQ